MSAFSAFRCLALPRDAFAPLFGLDDEALRRRGARRMIVDATPGYPCRLTLADAPVGASVLLVPYAHLDADTPYRASGPVFVREHAQPCSPPAGDVPAALRTRLISLRAYGADAGMRNADVVDGAALEHAIARCFEDPAVAFLHAHFARPGCYAARIERV
jgi:hypothetical protein